MIPSSRPNLSDLYTLPQSTLLENHTLHSHTYLCSPYEAVPPPPPFSTYVVSNEQEIVLYFLKFVYKYFFISTQVDLQVAEKLAPNDKSIKTEVARLKKLMEEKRQKDKQIYSKLFSWQLFLVQFWTKKMKPLVLRCNMQMKVNNVATSNTFSFVHLFLLLTVTITSVLR